MQNNSSTATKPAPNNNPGGKPADQDPQATANKTPAEAAACATKTSEQK